MSLGCSFGDEQDSGERLRRLGYPGIALNVLPGNQLADGLALNEKPLPKGD